MLTIHFLIYCACIANTGATTRHCATFFKRTRYCRPTSGNRRLGLEIQCAHYQMNIDLQMFKGREKNTARLNNPMPM